MHSGAKVFSCVMVVAALVIVILVAFGAMAEPIPGGPQAQREAAANSQDGPQQEKQLSPQEKMDRRFPQPVKVSFLIGLPMLDEKNSTLGRIESVQRMPDGKIALVIGYGGLFGLGEHPIAVPVELVAMLGHDVAAIDMPSEKFRTAPTWVSSMGTPIDPGETIRVAVTSRSL